MKLGHEETREYRARIGYPYRSHSQYGRALYAFVGCSLFIFFNGWDAFLGGTAPADLFLPSYISVSPRCSIPFELSPGACRTTNPDSSKLPDFRLYPSY